MTAPLELPKLVLGTMTFGDTVDISGAGSMLDAALGAGISHLDTANGYAGGESERMLAKLLHGRRDSVTLATKAGMPHPDAGDNSPLSAKGLRASIEGSLRRLDSDYVDLFYLHQPDRTVTLTETLTTVADWLPRARSAQSAYPTLPRGKSVKSTTPQTQSVLRDRSSHNSSTTCSRVASKKNTQNSRT